MSDWADDIAADVLKRLREDDYASFTTVVAAHLRAHVDDLMAERDRLKAALKPLADAADEFDWHKGDPTQVYLWAQSGGKSPKSITVLNARNARAALSGPSGE